MATAFFDLQDDVLAHLKLDQAAIAALCRTNGVRYLALFGSAVRDDFDPERSDLDFLVALDAPSAASYADRYFALKEGLEQLSGRTVDLLTERSISNPYLAEQIAAEKVTLYAA